MIKHSSCCRSVQVAVQTAHVDPVLQRLTSCSRHFASACANFHHKSISTTVLEDLHQKTRVLCLTCASSYHKVAFPSHYAAMRNIYVTKHAFGRWNMEALCYNLNDPQSCDPDWVVKPTFGSHESALGWCGSAGNLHRQGSSALLCRKSPLSACPSQEGFAWRHITWPGRTLPRTAGQRCLRSGHGGCLRGRHLVSYHARKAGGAEGSG